MLAWHIVIDWTGLGLYAAVTKAHSGPGQWGADSLGCVYHSAFSLSLSQPPPVYCACHVTASVSLSRSLKARAHVYQAAARLLL